MRLIEIHPKIWSLKNNTVSQLISIIRNKLSSPRDFRVAIEKLTVLIGSCASENFEIVKKTISSPIATCEADFFKNKLTIVPILRAGLAMSNALQDLFENCSVGHIGLARDPDTLKPSQYYEKLPVNVEGSDLVICDPLIATANSLCATIDIVKKYKPRSITVLGVIASVESLKTLNIKFPEICVYVAQIDEKMNENGYIIPGAGDAGDRIFGTK